MEFIEMAKEVAQLGVLTICAGIVCFFAVTGIFILKKWAEKKLLKENKLEHDEKINKRLKITPEVKNVLKELLLHTHAWRAYVFEFHNGKTNLGGLPFLFMSCTYEVLGQTASSQIGARQNMPFTLFDSLITKIMHNEVVTVDTRNKADDFDMIIYETMKKRGTIILIGTKLLDEHKRVIGFLGIDYCDTPDTAIIKNDEIALKGIEKIVFRDAQIISTLLNVKISKEEVTSNK